MLTATPIVASPTRAAPKRKHLPPPRVMLLLLTTAHAPTRVSLGRPRPRTTQPKPVSTVSQVCVTCLALGVS
eukprot:1658548-Prorocentrum_lima.AAC.1